MVQSNINNLFPDILNRYVIFRGNRNSEESNVENKEDSQSKLTPIKYDRLQNKSCAICLENYKCTETDIDNIVILPKCKHYFHEECINAWLTQKHECPVCREKVDI
jgi:hypothetical protein